MFGYDPLIAKTFDHDHHRFLLRTYIVCFGAFVLPLALIMSLLEIWAGIFLAVIMLLFFAPFLLVLMPDENRHTA